MRPEQVAEFKGSFVIVGAGRGRYSQRSFERRWGVPLGRQVRVLLRGELREREGVLRLLEEPTGLGDVLKLRLDDEVFEAGRIERGVRL